MLISSKLAQSVQGVQTFLREKTFSIKPQDEVKPVTISGANSLVERLAKGLMRKTRDKRADRYKDYIDELVSQIDLQKEVYERSPSRMAEKKKVLARLRYVSQQAGKAELPELKDMENLGSQYPELSASPSRRYTQELSFHYDRQTIEGDPNFTAANETRKRRQHEEFLKANPVQVKNAEQNQVFQGMTKWFTKNMKRIKTKKEKTLERQRSTTLLMANKSGKLEAHQVPADLSELIDQRKILQRQKNIRKMTRRKPMSNSVNLSQDQSSSRSGLLDTSNSENPLSRSTVFEKRQHSAYHELLAKINQSKMAVRKIKNGQGGLPGEYLQENQNIPFLRDQRLQENVRQYLRSGEMYIPKIQIISSAAAPQRSKYALSNSGPVKPPPHSITDKSLDFRVMNDYSTQPSTQIAETSMAIGNRRAISQLQRLPSIHERSKIPNLPQIEDPLAEDSLLQLDQMQISHRYPIADTQRGSVLGLTTPQPLPIKESVDEENIDLFDEVIHKEPVHQLKDLNLLDPFCLTERRFNRSLERQLVFPRNPTDYVLQKQASSGASVAGGGFCGKTPQQRRASVGQGAATDLISMVQFCQERNIPFCANEKRFYDFMQSKQRFRDWVGCWKRYCALEMYDIPEKPKEVPEDFQPQQNNFLKALMAMAKRAQEKQAIEEEEKQQKEAQESAKQKKDGRKHPAGSKERPHIQGQRSSHHNIQAKKSETITGKPEVAPLKSVIVPIPTQKPSPPPKAVSKEKQINAITASKKHNITPMVDDAHKDLHAKRVKNHLIKSLEAPIAKPNSKVVQKSLNDPVPKEMLDNLSGRPTKNPIPAFQDKGTKLRTAMRGLRAFGNRAPPNFYEKLDKRRRDINQRLLQIIERVELERPITFKEKFDVLWNAGVSDKDHVQYQISQQRHARHLMNQQMAEKYMQILYFIERRYKSTLTQKTAGVKSLEIRKSGTIDNSAKPTEAEREFLDFLRIIIKGGWVVQDNLEWVSIMDFVEVAEEISQNPQTKVFFIEVARVYGFEEEFEQHFRVGADDLDYK